MANKCWKEKSFGSNKFGVERKDNNLINIFFYKEEGEWKSHQNTRKQSRFRFHGSKQSAKKFAKSYMKSHNKC